MKIPVELRQMFLVGEFHNGRSITLWSNRYTLYGSDDTTLWLADDTSNFAKSIPLENITCIAYADEPVQVILRLKVVETEKKFKRILKLHEEEGWYEK